MCLIIHKPAGITVPREIISSALSRNRDGFGIMASNGYVARALSPTVDSCAAAIESVREYEAAIHWRMATQGKVNRDNCHPFKVHGHYLMHNGHISAYSGKGAASDTRLFAEKWFAPRAASGKRVSVEEIASAVGATNALAVMRPDRSIDIVNRFRGVSHAGLWLSNTYAWDAPASLRGNYWPWQIAGDDDDSFSLVQYQGATRDYRREDEREDERGAELVTYLMDEIANALPVDMDAEEMQWFEPGRGAPARDFSEFRRLTEGQCGVFDYLESVSAHTLLTIYREIC